MNMDDFNKAEGIVEDILKLKSKMDDMISLIEHIQETKGNTLVLGLSFPSGTGTTIKIDKETGLEVWGAMLAMKNTELAKLAAELEKV